MSESDEHEPPGEVWYEEPPRPEGEEDFALEAIRNGMVPLVGAVVTFVWTFLIPSPSADVVLLLGSMGMGSWAAWAGWNHDRKLVALHGASIVLLDLLTLVSAPL